jgi:predicted DNA-binding protein
MTAVEMPRKDKGFRLDTRIIEALAQVKKLTGKTANAYVEEMLLANLKSLGLIPMDEEPLPETRGGSNKKATDKPKASPSANTVDPASTPADRIGGEGAIDE